MVNDFRLLARSPDGFTYFTPNIHDVPGDVNVRQIKSCQGEDIVRQLQNPEAAGDICTLSFSTAQPEPVCKKRLVNQPMREKSKVYQTSLPATGWKWIITRRAAVNWNSGYMVQKWHLLLRRLLPCRTVCRRGRAFHKTIHQRPDRSRAKRHYSLDGMTSNVRWGIWFYNLPPKSIESFTRKRSRGRTYARREYDFILFIGRVDLDF